MTDPIERMLRDTLAEQARQAPRGDGLAERIIAAADRPRPVAERHRHWRAWTLPLVAAASVAAVVGGLAGSGVLQPHHASRPAAQPGTPLPSSSVPAPSTPAPSPSSAAPSPSTTASSAPPSTASTVAVPPATGPVPAHFRVLDATFAGASQGWALGTGQCFTDASKTCTALIRTSDGGATWVSVPNPPANLPGVRDCAAPCVEHIRFANTHVGYAYGPNALFMTTDGTHWTRLGGGADALETLDGNVIRVRSDQPGCPPGCTYRVQVAPVGQPVWHDVALPGAQVVGDRVTLARTGSAAYLVVHRNPAGGAGNATSTLYGSADDGATWTDRGEPCPQDDGEADTASLTTAADGAVTVLCRLRVAPGWQFTATTTDGTHWRVGDRHALGAAQVTALATPSGSTLLVSSDDTYRSTDSGRTWRRLDANAGSDPGGQLRWLGFETPTTGRAVSHDGSAIWTTTDAGATWTQHAFG